MVQGSVLTLVFVFLSKILLLLLMASFVLFIDTWFSSGDNVGFNFSHTKISRKC